MLALVSLSSWCRSRPVPRSGWPTADWIIDRFFRFRADEAGSAPGWAEDAERMNGYLREIPFARYSETRLPEVDTAWKNLPEPGMHLYRAPTDGRRITIYRKVGP